MIARDWFTLKEKVLSDSRALSADSELLCRMLLTYATNEKFYSLDFGNLRQKCTKLLDKSDEDLPSDEGEFYDYVVKNWLWLDSLPRDRFFEIYHKAIKDLKLISAQIEEYTATKTKLERRRSQKFDEVTEYEFQMYSHFLQLLTGAKDEIIEFITDGLPRYAIKKSQRLFFDIPSFFDFPYSYAFFPALRLDASRVTALSNKFLSLDIQAHRRLQELFASDPAKFLSTAIEYIGKEEIASKIEEMTEKHHLLAPRKDIIREALEAYKTGNHLIFIHILPLQIEGLFHDLCIEFGVAPEKLAKESINQKLKRLRAVTHVLRHYEYYAFRFPLIRNKVAHGQYLGESKELTAAMLILDLFDVCSQVTSEKIFINRATKFMTSVDEKAPSERELLTIAILYNESFSDFYGLNEKLHELHLKLEEPQFWSSLLNKLPDLDPPIKVGLYRFAKIHRSNNRDKGVVDSVISAIEQGTVLAAYEHLTTEDIASELIDAVELKKT